MILAADLHLRRNRPRARVDDYWLAQETKLRYTLRLGQESPPLLIAGDFFNQPRPGPFLERWVIELLKEYGIRPIVVPGQHDLPERSLGQLPDSGLGVLAAAGVIELLGIPRPGEDHSMSHQAQCGPFGERPWGGRDGPINFAINGWPYDKQLQPVIGGFTVLLWHHMVINSEPLWPGQVADKADSILLKLPQFDLILTGDNHQTFVKACGRPYWNKDRWLINPGSMMRMTTAQINHRPCVFKWESNEVEQIFLPIQANVFDLTQLEVKERDDDRILVFVESLDKQWQAGFSYERSLEDFMKIQRTKPEVQFLVRKCLEPKMEKGL